MSRRRTTALTLAVLLVVSAVAASGGVALAGSTPDDDRGGGPPAGFVGVASSNIHEDLPEQARGPGGEIPRGPAWQGQVMASSNASTLGVTVSTAARAGQGDPQGGPNAVSRLALVLEDDSNHAGRQVTVHVDLLEQALGYVPREATVAHESGDTYETRLERRGEWVVFDVREFSTNTVTFDGEVSLSGSQATDGATFTYDLNDHTGATDPTGDLTGVEATEWDNVSASGLANGDTLTVNPAGHRIDGPAAGEPQVVFTGEGFERADSASATGLGPTGTLATGVDGNLDPTNDEFTLTAHSQSATSYDGSGTVYEESFVAWDTGSSTGRGTDFQIDNPPETVTGVRIYVSKTTTSGVLSVDVRVSKEAADTAHTEGTLVKQGWNPTWSTGWQTIQFDQPIDTSGTNTVTIELKTTSGDGDIALSTSRGYNGPNGYFKTWSDIEGNNSYSAARVEVISDPKSVSVSDNTGTSTALGNLADGETVTQSFDMETSTSELAISADGGTFDLSGSWTERAASQDPAVDLDGDGVDDVTHSGLLNDTETATYTASSLSPGDDTATFSTAGGSTVTAEVQLEEVVETRDPTVTVNGQVAGSHTGTLAAGETVSFTGDSTALANGTNSVNISVGDGTLSADAPTPRVGFTYSHSATFDQSVSYQGETWSERYDVNRTWGDGGTDAKLTVPFEGNVVAIRDLTVYINGTETPPSWSRFEENSTTLEVGLGDVNPDATTRVVATGSKVRVGGGGAINVLEPTVAGDGLNSKVELASWSNDSYIDVSGTSKGSWVHHTAAESWDTPETYATVTASGSQTLHLPDAVSGSTARVRTVPLEVTPETGGVEVAVLEEAVDVDGDGTTDSPRFRVRQGNAAGADAVEVAFHDVQSGETYELYSETDEQGVDTDTAESPVFFTTSGDAATYVVRLFTGSSGDPPPVVQVGEDSSDSSGESPFGSLLVLGGVVGGILAFWYVGRRWTGARGFRDNYLLLAGGGAVALVGVSAVGGGSAWTVLERVAATPAGAIVGALAAMLAIQRFDEWTGWVPTLAKAAAALGLVFWVIQVLTDGALTEGVSRVAPFLVVLGVLVFAILAWRALKGPTINIRGGGGAA